MYINFGRSLDRSESLEKVFWLQLNLTLYQILLSFISDPSYVGFKKDIPKVYFVSRTSRSVIYMISAFIYLLPTVYL